MRKINLLENRKFNSKAMVKKKKKIGPNLYTEKWQNNIERNF